MFPVKTLVSLPWVGLASCIVQTNSVVEKTYNIADKLNRINCAREPILLNHDLRSLFSAKYCIFR